MKTKAGMKTGLFLMSVLVAAQSELPSNHSIKALVLEDKLLSPNGQPGDAFGWSVSVYGNRALVGAYLADDNGSNSGAAYVLAYDGFNWQPMQKILPADGAAFDGFGTAVSLFGDRALIGAPGNGSHGDRSGATYVFEFDGLNWNQTQKLSASDASAFDEFGQSVSLHSDRTLVGAYLNDDGGNNSGSAYLFDFDGNSWNQTQKLTASDASTADNFGYAVAVLADRALVGAYLDDDNGSNSGSAYVFEFDGLGWIQKQKLTASDGTAFDGFARALSLSGDRIMVGAAGDDDNGENAGAAYLYERDGMNWVQRQKLLAMDGTANDGFGGSISLFGHRALIGAPSDDANGNNSGSVYLFSDTGISWSQSQKLTANPSGSFDNFGHAVGLSDEHAVAGVPGDDDNGPIAGAVYAFVDDLIFKNGFDPPTKKQPLLYQSTQQPTWCMPLDGLCW